MRPARVALLLLASAALALLLLPFFALWHAGISSPWRLAPGDWRAIRISIGYTLLACGIIAVVATPAAYWLARSAFHGKIIIEALVLLPLLTPPLALGILLSSLFGPYGLLGKFFSRWNIDLTNSAPAFVLAQVYAAAPYYLIAARMAFANVPRELEEAGLTLGLNRRQVFGHVTVPLAAMGLAVALALAWVRALGEFGVALIMAYFPQGVPVKLWVNLNDFGLHSVYPLLWLFFLMALPVPMLLLLISQKRFGVGENH